MAAPEPWDRGPGPGEADLGFYEGPSTTASHPSAWHPAGPGPATGRMTDVPIFGPPPPTRHPGDPGAVYTLGFWQALFDVDTKDVGSRILSALRMAPPEYLRHLHPYTAVPQAMDPEGDPAGGPDRKPDLYGPFWIGTTLWLVCVVASHTLTTLRCQSGLRTPTLCTQSWFTPIAVGGTLVFGFEFGGAAGLWAALRWRGVAVGLLDLCCLHGYSFFIFVPAAALWVVPGAWLHWLAALAAAALSAGNIVSNLQGLWRQHLDPQMVLSATAAVVALQLDFAVSLLLTFAA